jgi:hypothetical protein
MYYMKGKLSECGSKVRKGLDRAGDLNRTDAARRRRIVSYRRAAYVGVRL